MHKGEKHKQILTIGNAAISAGDHEGFLKYCDDDTEWIFVGEQTLKGKEAVRQYMAQNYIEPPKFNTKNLIAEGNFLVATGDIALKDKNGKETQYAYCDVWEFSNEKIIGLKAFVI